MTEAGRVLDIGDDFMLCGQHTAKRTGDHWVVSWLPGRRVTRSEAITAMTLVYQISRNASPHGARWPFIAAHAGELGLSGQEAVRLVTGEGDRIDV